jgi:hypothetical protein
MKKLLMLVGLAVIAAVFASGAGSSITPGSEGTPGCAFATFADGVLTMGKVCETADNSDAYGLIDYTGPLSQLSFEYNNDAYCGAGAPGFFIQNTDGYYRAGCAGHGTQTDLGDGWTRIDFAPGDVSPLGSAPPFDFADDVLLIAMLQDEQGISLTRNISVNENIQTPAPAVGAPGGPKHGVSRSAVCVKGVFTNISVLQVPGYLKDGAVPAIYVRGYGLMCQLTDLVTYGGKPGDYHLVPGVVVDTAGDKHATSDNQTAIFPLYEHN